MTYNSMTSDTAIVIPARLAASRLPGKPLADIGGLPMVIRVAKQAALSKMGDVIIACCGPEISQVASDHGFKAVITDPSLPSGTDRVQAALKSLAQNYQYIINLQGDLPLADPKIIVAVKEGLQRSEMSTACCEITDLEKIDNPNVVKAIFTEQNKALYFTRATAPSGPGKLYEHIGIYGYLAHTLEKFVSFKETLLEKRERLEQLRALEHGIEIRVAIVDEAPLAVDTHEDLVKLRQLVFASKRHSAS